MKRKAEAGMKFYTDAFPQVHMWEMATMWHLYTVGHIVALDLARISRRFGLSIGDVHLLSVVRIDDWRPIRSIDLAQTLNVSQAALSARIERLIRDGMLIKTRQANDQRAFTLELSEKGAKVADESVLAFSSDAELVRVLTKLGSDDLEALTRILGKVHDELDRSIVAGFPGDT